MASKIPKPSALLQRFVLWLASAQTRRPGFVLMLVGLTLIPAGLAVSRLQLKTSFGELLPDNKPSVIELRRVAERVPSNSTLTVTAESGDTELLKRFVDELTPKLRALPPELVTAVDPGPKDAEQFFEENRHLYAPLGEIELLHEEVTETYDREVGRRSGFDLGLDDEDETEEAGEASSAAATSLKEKLEGRFKKAVDDARRAAPGMDGYYIGEDGHLAAILVRTTLPSMDMRAYELQDTIGKLIEEGGYDKVDPSFRYGFTGNLITSVEQFRAVRDDLVTVGASGVGLVLAVVFFFFLRLRAILSLGVSIAVGCTWALAFAWLSIGHLNTATGFLVSIIAGNGINSMVIWMARYLEARRKQGMNVAEALHTASRDTCEATLAVVGVGMVSFGALVTTDFRGFRHFGIIGGAGMLLCWLATYSVLPAVMALCERVSPLPEKPSFRDRLSAVYGRPFTWVVRRSPAPIAIVGLLMGLGATVCTVLYFKGDPMEYNLSNILNDETSPTSAGRLSTRVNKITGRLNQGGRAVLVDRLDQVQPLVQELERRRDAAPPENKPFDQVVSIFTLLPADQDKKLELLREIIDRVERGRKRGLVSGEDWAELQKHIPEQLARIDIDSLPELVSRPFRERNGDLGKVVYVSPTPGKSLNDARYLMLWANSFRTVTLPGDEVIHGTGDAVVFTDMLLNISEDAPRVAFTSLGGTLLVILFAFGWRRAGWVAMATLLLGITWLIATLFLAKIKLNFLNFVAIPVAIGAGADYAINIMKRREIEGPSGVERAMIETGGAVVACSMTTLCGYLALLLSINGAVRSFGLTAAIGELATQISAMLVLPAVLFWRARRSGDQPLPVTEEIVPQPTDPADGTAG